MQLRYANLIALLATSALPALAGAASYSATWNGPRVAIPDNDPAGVEITLEVSGASGSIESLAVHFEGPGVPANIRGDRNAGIDHPFPNDLQATLVSPSGTEVRLFSRIPPATTNYNIAHTVLRDDASNSIQSAIGEAPFVEAYRPKDALSAFNGETPNGTWTLRIADLGADDEGGVNGWGLHFSTSSSTPPDAPVAVITEPLNDRTLSPAQGIVGVAGFVMEGAADILSVEWRSVPPGIDPAIVNWSPANTTSPDWETFTFSAPLAFGANAIEVRATDNAGVQSLIARRTIVRDDFQYTDPQPDFALVDEAQDIWVALTKNGIVGTANVIGQDTGLAHDALTGAKVLTADVTGNGFLDFLGVSPTGEVRLVRNNGSMILDDPEVVATGFQEDEYEGHGVFAGDFNGNGLADLVQISPNGRVQIAYGNGEGFAALTTALNESILRHRPNEGFWIGIGDVTGDGRDDIVFADPAEGVFVVEATASGFSSTINKWAGAGLFRYRRGSAAEPFSAQPILLVDFNGNGRKDLATLTVERVLFVSPSATTFFDGVRVFPDTNLRFAPYQGQGGWHLFAADMNSDGMEDIVQVNEFGEISVSYSTGNRYRRLGSRLAWPTPRFQENILGPKRVFLGRFGE